MFQDPAGTMGPRRGLWHACFLVRTALRIPDPRAINSMVGVRRRVAKIAGGSTFSAMRPLDLHRQHGGHGMGHLIGGAYEFNPATQTTEVIVEFPNPDYLLRPGLNVTLQSSIREK